MSQFGAKVFRAFNLLQASHRFLPARATAGGKFAVILRKESDDIYTYIFVRDGRMNDANMDVDMWVAPLHEAGDGLDKLYIGFKIRIASEYDIDDKFFEDCEKRIVTLLSCVPQISLATQRELREPSFQTRRYQTYQIERKALSALLMAAKQHNEDAMNAIGVANRVVDGKGTCDDIEIACISAAEQLLHRNVFDYEVVDFFEKSASQLGASISQVLYPFILGEKSMGI